MSDNVERTESPASQELSGRIDKYEIVRKLGKGAMGVVYLAHDTVLDRDVALKVMATQTIDDPELTARFKREALAVAKITHRNVVTIYDLGSHEGAPYIAMELLKGQDLARIMRKGKGSALSLERKVAIIAQVLSGLGHAHQAGIVHRDIKPANVFLNLDGTVKIMDFGVARLTAASMTGTGSIVGTADYMSPEQVQGAKVDGRSDLFAVGCLLYELVTGQRPFHADNLMTIFYKITHEGPAFQLMPKDPAHQALIPILRKALAKRLVDRYATAHEFAADLHSYLRSHATSESTQQLIEQLVASGPPPGTPPPPLTDAYDLSAAPTVVEIGGASLGMPTQRPALGMAQRVPATVRATPARGIAMPLRKPVSSRMASTSRGVTRLAVAVAAIGAGAVGFFLWRQSAPELPLSRATTLPTAATPPATILRTAAPSPRQESSPEPIAATPLPTLTEPARQSAAMRAAQTAFQKGDYSSALSRAQEALREDPSSVEARQLADNAAAGGKAASHFHDAQEALSAGDLDGALRAAEAGRVAAPWDARGAELVRRIRSAQEQAEGEAVKRRDAESERRLTQILDRADAALLAQNYERAIALYEEVLRQDPSNARAGQGKTGAVSARALARAAGGVDAPAVRRFVSGRTVTQTVESRRAGSVPSGFEPSEEVVVHRGAQALELPGAVQFEVQPEAVTAGERYTVKVYLLNEGSAAIQLLDMRVSTTINGRKSGGVVPAPAKEVGPKQRALLLNQSDVWREEYVSWSMEVSLRSIRGDVYRNEVSWK